MSRNPPSIADPYAYLGITRNVDGSITRTPEFFPSVPPSTYPGNPVRVLTKDVPINEQNNTWARLYLQRSALDTIPIEKLALVVYFHGGGFIICTASSTMFQKFCFDVAPKIPALIVSVDYRLAPEHRLPAAYADCMGALHWIKTSPDEWISKFADFSKCYVMGISVGGN